MTFSDDNVQKYFSSFDATLRICVDYKWHIIQPGDKTTELTTALGRRWGFIATLSPDKEIVDLKVLKNKKANPEIKDNRRKDD